MKPSFTNQTRPPATDAKFHPTDEHLIAEDKQEVAKMNHGDKLETEKGHVRDNNENGEQSDRATAP